jgi:hypothetical protein
MQALGVEYDINNIALPHITKRLTNWRETSNNNSTNMLTNFREENIH